MPKDLRVFDINLNEREYTRWDEVIAEDKRRVSLLIEETEESLGHIPRPIRKVASLAASIGYRVSGGKYVDEMRSWADALKRPLGDVVLSNLVYELSHVNDDNDTILGCTAGVRKFSGYGLVHARSLDWSLDRTKNCSRVFRFHNGERQFVTVGVSGYVGVLSGMLPGKYSVTINWAPALDYPAISFGPSFLLREVFETCDSYDEAVYALSKTNIATSVFYTVCGSKAGQACVIERTDRHYSIRRLADKDVLVQGNHFSAARFLKANDEELVEDSVARMSCLTSQIQKLRPRTLRDVLSCLRYFPVLNSETRQQMVFCPKSGKYLAVNP